MAVARGVLGSIGSSSSSSSWMMRGSKNKKTRTRCVAATYTTGGGLAEQYRTLRIEPGASEKEVKKAFRKLALQYHPDVCKGSNCRVQFHRINEAYDIVMSALRESEEPEQSPEWGDGDADDDSMRGMYDPTWDLWEEWMGWEGAGIRDYTSHINPYI